MRRRSPAPPCARGSRASPTAHLDERALDIRLLLDHRDKLVRNRSDDQRRLRWHLHDLFGELETEIAGLVEREAPQLVAERDCGALRAAKLIGDAGAERFPSDAQLARAAGVSPVAVSSRRRNRHRLDRGANRQLNCALHRLAVNKGRLNPESAAYLARKQAEGKTRMEALRCLKRDLARRVHRLLSLPTDQVRTLDTVAGLP